jgi:tRNA wybutosine-synthesizing protein 3
MEKTTKDLDVVFESSKRTVLHKLKVEADRSPKGSIDEPIKEFVSLVNSTNDFVTLSSCSGRLSLFAYSSRNLVTDDKEGFASNKGEGTWIYVSHGPEIAPKNDLFKYLLTDSEKNILLKTEPMIFHIQARSLDASSALLRVAFDAGFRESGISIGTGGKIVVAIRSTAERLEVPLMLDGVSLHHDTYLGKLYDEVLKRFALINDRREKFISLFRSSFPNSTPSIPSSPSIGECKVVCKSCGMTFPSKNKMYNTHLVPVATDVSKKECPNPIANTLQHTKCSKCHESFPSRNKLFSHLQRSVSCSNNHSSLITLEDKAASLLARQSSRNLLSKMLHGEVINDTIEDLEKVLNDEIPVSSWRIVENSSSLLNRWGHCSAYIEKNDVRGGILIVFGGICADGVHRRSNSLVIYDSERNIWYAPTLIEGGLQPTPRTRSAAVGLSHGFFIWGGHNGIQTPLNDAWFLKILVDETNQLLFQWFEMRQGGNVPASRWGHSMNVFTSKDGASNVIIFGGRNLTDSFDDIYVGKLGFEGETCSIHWERILCSMDTPFARYYHASTLIYSAINKPVLIVHGGLSHPVLPLLHDNDDEGNFHRMFGGKFHLFDISEKRWYTHELDIDGSKRKSLFRFSHSLVSLSQNTVKHRMMLFGGNVYSIENNHACFISMKTNGSMEHVETNIAYIHVDSSAYMRKNDFVHLPLTCRSSLVVVPLEDNNIQLFSLGGGAVALAFGSYYGSSLSVKFHVDDFFNQSAATSGDFILQTSAIDLLDSIKQELLSRSWYDSSRKIAKMSNELFGIPINRNCIQGIIECLKSGKNDSNLIDAILNRKVHITKGNLPGLYKVSPDGKLILKSDRFSALQTHLRDYLSSLQLNEQDISELLDLKSQCGGMMHKLEWLGDVLLLPSWAFTDPRWFSSSTPDELWSVISGLLSCRIARYHPIDTGPKRESRIEMLYLGKSVDSKKSLELTPETYKEDIISLGSIICGPGNSWVKVLDNGIQFYFDITKTMFSSGNISEKLRVAKFSAKNEVVVDMYAGIGYWVLPLLLKAHASFVHAADWNPYALATLRINLQANNVESTRVKIWPGDNQQLGNPENRLIGIADRVLCGLLPSSKLSWPVAVRLLKETGGTIHIHENVSERELDSWLEELPHTLMRYWNDSNKQKNIMISVRHCEKVKSYAPGIWHVVADVIFERK